ncbi:MAG TPA: HEAT repeat domain-containing protein [Clostridia bacterium]|nr:HEAT repeat domain-containing protein [Clostridia bacterium]
MGRAIIISGGLLFLLSLGWLGAKLLALGEPAYQGKSLIIWLKEFEEARYNGPTSRYHLSPAEFQGQFVEPTQKAVRHMGTNALPQLLNLLQARESFLHNRTIALLNKVPALRWRPLSQQQRQSMALAGFSALGTNAQAAVPALIALLDDKDPEIRKYSAWCLGAVGPAAEAAVPALLQHLQDANALVQDASETSLGAIHRRADLVVPVLIERLSKKEGRFTDIALGMFGREAKAAVPAILPLLDDPNGDTQARMAMTLWRIDPEAAAKAGLKAP